MLGPDMWTEVEPTMAGEDFGFLAQAAPGTFLFLNMWNETVGASYSNHNPRFQVWAEEGIGVGDGGGGGPTTHLGADYAVLPVV